MVALSFFWKLEDWKSVHPELSRMHCDKDGCTLMLFKVTFVVNQAASEIGLMKTDDQTLQIYELGSPWLISFSWYQS